MTDFPPTLSEQIAESVIELIAKGEIELCSRLTEKDLMSRFSVSQTVIREARLLLESKGLLTTYPRKGTYVNSPSGAEISMLFKVRATLDVFASRNAAQNHTPEDIADLRDLCSAAEQAYQQEDFFRFFRISRKFHKRIYECSGFSCLIRIYDDLTTLTDLFHYNAHVSKNISLEDDVMGHRHICDAIETGSPDFCESVVLQHIETVRSRDLEIIGALDNEKNQA